MRRGIQIRQFGLDHEIQEGCSDNAIVRKRSGDYQDDFMKPLAIRRSRLTHLLSNGTGERWNRIEPHPRRIRPATRGLGLLGTPELTAVLVGPQSFVGMILSDLERDPPFVADPHHVRAGVVLEPSIRITQPRASNAERRQKPSY